MNRFLLFQKALNREVNALQSLLDSLEEASVEVSIETLLKCRGKVVFIGIGKSGLVARKLAATYSSIGIPSIFMHASDALHGDIGIINAEDVTVSISNSGKTEEIVALLPHLRARSIPQIAIVGNKDSVLAQAADVCVFSGVDQEADEYNLVPSCSTTVQMAIGDCIGIAVSMIRGLTPSSFAINHPSGRLGKQLTLRVSDLMHSGSNNPLIDGEASFEELLEVFGKLNLGAVNVVNSDKELVGVVTDGDMRRAFKLLRCKPIEEIRILDVCTKNPIVVEPQQSAIEALGMMENRRSQISVVPVVALGKCIGLLRLHDIVKAGL